ncbi:MAG: GNAT family N-acetyltransferase [Flavobacteriales bacterium]
MSITIKLIGPADRALLDHVAEGVFDFAVDPHWAAVVIADPRHHLVLAIDDGLVVGMATAVDYVHPDKAPQFWINEVGVAPTHRSRGIATQLLDALLQHGRAIGCTEAWVGTETTNAHARRLYVSAGGVEDTGFVLYEFALADPSDRSPTRPR